MSLAPCHLLSLTLYYSLAQQPLQQKRSLLMPPAQGPSTPLPYLSHTPSLATSLHSTWQKEAYIKTQHLMQKL